MVVLGIEKLVKSPKSLKGRRVGLVANATSIDGNLVSSVDLLKNHPDINLVALFGPQQGFWGETQDNMIEWRDGRYPRYKLPLYSLYGRHRKPTGQMLKNIDTLVFDVQDVGTRVYTYIWTMALCMQACAELGKEFIVCDRPNPIGGVEVEGNVSSLKYSSFVALYPLPMRHAMTPAEIAQYVNSEYKIGCNLTVVGLEGWKRSMWHDETGLPWVIPSANIPTLETAAIYPGTVIFEGTNISEGRGTTRPFEFIGAPFVDGFELAENLVKYELPGVVFRPCVFIPTFGKYQGENCGGVQIHVTNRKTLVPVKTVIAILLTIRDLYSGGFKWKEPPYEYVYDELPVDVICGTDWIRKSVDARDELDVIMEKMAGEVKEFNPIREKYLLY